MRLASCSLQKGLPKAWPRARKVSAAEPTDQKKRLRYSGAMGIPASVEVEVEETRATKAAQAAFGAGDTRGLRPRFQNWVLD